MSDPVDPFDVFERLLHEDYFFRFETTVEEDDYSHRIAGIGHWPEIDHKVWKLWDRRGNFFTISYAKIHKPPLVTTGWSKIRKFYGLKGTFKVWFRFIKYRQYFISIHDPISGLEIHYPKPLPTINALPDVEPGNPSLPQLNLSNIDQVVPEDNALPVQAVQFVNQFRVTLTKAKLRACHLDIPLAVSPFVTQNGVGPWTFVGPTGIRHFCSVIVPRDRKRSNKFGSGWKAFCASHHFQDTQVLMVKLTDEFTREAHVFIEQ